MWGNLTPLQQLQIINIDRLEASFASRSITIIMQAVVFKGPLQVALEQRPRPQIQASTDVILKVRYTALCGR